MLTETQARRIRPSDTPFADGSVTGLRLIPTNAKGRGKWQLRFVSPEVKRRRDMGLGTYPDVSIATAREHALKARKLLSAGVDPLEEKIRQQQQSAKEVQVPTFEEAARMVHEEHKAGWSNGKHVNQWINTLKTYALPVLGTQKVNTLKPSDFADVLRPIWSAKPETARRVKQRCHTVMKWCWGKEFVQANPVDIVDMLLPKQKAAARQTIHHPAMPWQLVPEFVREVIRTGDDVTRHLLEFTILTAGRSGETRGVTWDEIDFKTSIWVVPAERMKTRRSHRVPLSSRALELIRKRKVISHHPSLIFASPRGGSLSDMALTKFLRARKAISDTPDRIATAHGFRSSFRNWASETGVQRDLAERALSHFVHSAVESAYHRTDLLEQRRSVMQVWSDHVIGAS